MSTAVTTLAFVFIGIYGVIVSPITIGQVLAVLVFSGTFTLAMDGLIPKYYAFEYFLTAD